jgi:SMC interacting uncharacterized protein involved in chromosome segregation
MSNVKERVDKLVDSLKQERDELRVKLHLGKLEASDEWQEIEVKFEKLQSKAKVLGEATADSSKDIGAAVMLLGKEIRDGFKRIAKRL